jgi:hypothetical protein
MAHLGPSMGENPHTRARRPRGHREKLPEIGHFVDAPEISRGHVACFQSVSRGYEGTKRGPALPPGRGAESQAPRPGR